MTARSVAWVLPGMELMVHLRGVPVGADVAPEVWSPEHDVAAAVIARAVKDLDSVRQRAAALAWLSSEEAAPWLEGVGLVQDDVLAALAARAGPENTVLTPAQQRTLQAVADLENAGEMVTVDALDALTGRRSSQLHLATLEALGLVERIPPRGGVRLTPEGRRALGGLRNH